MKIYLVPSDFSKSSQNALSFAIKFAQQENSKIVLLHVLDKLQSNSKKSGLFSSKKLESEKQKTKEKLQRICNEIITQKNVTCEFMQQTGDLVKVIVATQKSLKPHLVIIGRKEENYSKEKKGKSKTLKILEQTESPVLIVPEHIKYTGIKKITYATNYLAGDKSALQLLIKKAKPFGAQVNSIHVAEENYNLTMEMELLRNFSNYISDNLQYHNLSFQLIPGQDVGKELHKHAEENTTNILAISICKNSKKSKIIRNKITKNVLFTDIVPLLIIPGLENNQAILN